MAGNKKAASLRDEQHRIARPISVLLTGAMVIALYFGPVILGCVEAQARAMKSSQG